MPDEISGTDTRATLPMSVANMTFMVNRLGKDCAPLQFVRELTQNSIEGLSHLADRKGEIRWDVDWNRHDLTDAYKLCVIDTGVGMTGPEMVHYINQLSSSIHEQSDSGNFGVGAKISAAPLNREGLLYLSWKEGRGSMIHLWFDPDAKVYGLRRFPENKGEFWTHIEDSIKPEPIEDHGTMVVMLGNSLDENTMTAPAGAATPSRWVLRYLNARYFRFPEGMKVSARESWELPRDDKHNALRVVTGQGPWLDDKCESKGTIQLSNASAHWWIIRDEVDRHSGHTAPGGHMAALYQDELYEMALGRSAFARLQGFGVIFGCSRVVIYVEPDTEHQTVTSNTPRTQLIVDGDPLDWAQLASEFREQLPEELIRLQEEIGAESGYEDHKKAIRERLKQIRDLLRFSRFRPAADGSLLIDRGSASDGGTPAKSDQQRASRSGGGGSGGRAGDIYALFAENEGEPADPVNSSMEPQTRWITIENGMRTKGDLEDRAARFHVDQNLLLINGDFRVFTNMIERWEARYSEVSGVKPVIEAVVHEWFEQQLVEAVMSAIALRKGNWSTQEIEQLWSEEALTAAVLPRYHIDVSIKRALGSKLGKQAAA